ncbi:hypothetical protein C6P41_004552 [Kluyveromyces marxianus]|nr:hypothetical protein C6P43_004394 [Kluyveromyces marxianus]KAG0685543.1 hypothetical protein C6P41_004552 [Kluyveromyces marxianus]
MFQLPIINRSSRNRKRRRIRYQYINTLQKRYDQIYNAKPENQSSVGMLTPENSESESTELDKTRRRKKTLQSVLGNALDSSDEEMEEDDNNLDEINNPEMQFFENYTKPESTYEVWNFDANKRAPINKQRISYNTVKKLEKAADKVVTKGLNYQTKKSNMYFQALKHGYDIHSKPELMRQKSMHLAHLNQLLHINLLRQNWNVAYRCFSLLIRFEEVDVRSLWAIGSELLKVVQGPESNESYLEWFSQVFSSRMQFNQGTNYSLDPVFRSGSRTHAPVFVLSWLWTRLFDATSSKITSDKQGSLQSLIDRIGEMVLSPPYIEDAEVWFIFGLTHLVMASELSYAFRQKADTILGSRADIARNNVIQHINTAKNCLQTCKSIGKYKFPEKEIEQQLLQLERSLYSDDLNEDSSDEDSGNYAQDDEHDDNSDDQMISNENFGYSVTNKELLDTQTYQMADLGSESESDVFGNERPITFGYESD